MFFLEKKRLFLSRTLRILRLKSEKDTKFWDLCWNSDCSDVLMLEFSLNSAFSVRIKKEKMPENKFTDQA